MAAVQVLIVEDNPMIVSDIAAQIEDSGYQVCGTTATGQGAVRLSERTQPDLILMDVNLDGNIDGVQAARRIRDRRHVPIIFITGTGDPALLRRIESFDEAAFLEKPVTQAELTVAIRRMLPACAVA